jgi:hypothetical protein
MLTKIIENVKRFQYEIYLGSCFALIAVISYNLGRTTLFNHGSINYTQNANIIQAVDFATDGATITTNNKLDKRVVASRSATSKLYHFTWCSGAKRIKEENKLWFTTEADAISAGYSLAANCQ